MTRKTPTKKRSAKKKDYVVADITQAEFGRKDFYRAGKMFFFFQRAFSA